MPCNMQEVRLGYTGLLSCLSNPLIYELDKFDHWTLKILNMVWYKGTKKDTSIQVNAKINVGLYT